jgi:Ceramidase
MITKMQKSIITRSVAYTFAMLLVYFLLDKMLSGNVWQGMVPSKSALVGEYCEFNHTDKFFHQQMNTYSNLIYFFFGIWICLLAREDFKSEKSQNRLIAFPELSFLMGFCFIYLSFGSAFFHASLTWVGQRVDMNGTYGLSISLFAIGFHQVFYQIPFSAIQKKVLLAFILLLILAFYQVHLLISSSILLPIMILLIWMLTIINYFQFRRNRSLILAVLSFFFIIIALKIRQNDVDKINCDPHSLWQGHSIWHLLAGLSSFCSYAFFRFWK